MVKRILAIVSAIMLASSTVAPALAAVGNPPADPTNLVASNVSDTAISLNWTDNSNTETDFVIYYSNDNWATASSFSVPMDTVQYDVTGLLPNTQYRFRVQAVDTSDINNVLSSNSAESNALFTYASKPGQPAVGVVTMTTIPLTLNANGNPNDTLYSVTWSDQNTNHGSSVDGSGDAAISGIVKETKAIWDNSGLVKGLTPGHTYTFRIFSYNNDGNKAPENNGFIDTGKVTTLADPNKPTTPIISYAASEEIANANSQSILVKFGQAVNPGNETKFSVSYSADNGATYSDPVVMPIAGDGSPDVCRQENRDVIANCYNYTITGLKPVTPYLLRVATINDTNDVSDYANVLVTTGYNAILPPMISNITDKSVDATIDTNNNPGSLKYQLIWVKVHYDENNDAVYEKLSNNGFIAADGSFSGEGAWQTPAEWAKVSVHGFADQGFQNLDFAMGAFAVENGVEIVDKGGSNKKRSALTKPFTLKPVKVEQQSPQSSGGGGGGGNAFVPTPPTLSQNAVVVVEGDVTNHRTITLKLSAGNAVQVAISEKATFEDAVWQDYTDTKQFTLSAGNGQKTIYVKFRSTGGGETASVKASTNLIGQSTNQPAVVENVPNTTGQTGQVLGEKISLLDELVAALKPGNRGAKVVSLQNELKKLGFFPRGVRSTGYYGPVTKAAVAKYLASH